ncbi:MAG: glycosyltransferase family 4 protein [Actinobacteria bacterium]|nr:glycosyltransferase family 4 protein [Actinomycetota bacterium]
MRVLIFHGYLLHGTGSNVYNANLAAALVQLGHEVHLLCQERAADELPFVDAVGDWDGGSLAVRMLREPVRCTVYRPALAGLLPVYVADRYAGIEARPFPDCSDEEVAAYVEANVRAVREVVARARPDVALANHLVMSPLILARALAGSRVPYAVKIHGSALEYTVAPHPERFLPPAREGLAGAHGILVGSGHTEERLVATLGDPALRGRVRLGPPGVDVARFGPRPPAEARAGLQALAARLARAAEAEATPDDAQERSAFARDAGEAAAALADVAARPQDRLVAFVGKLIVSKGIDLLVAAWPLVLQREPRARLVVVGFGAYRAALERIVEALAAGDLAALDALVAAGRAEEGGPAAPLQLLRAFLDELAADDDARARYLAAAATLRERIVLTGRLDHDELVDLLPACEALVVPSTFPEAFGMVAAEGAACGALPICAGHSGLAEVAGTLAQAIPAPARPWLAFSTAADGDPVRAIAARLTAWLEAPPELVEETRTQLVATVRERWSWEGVARGMIAAAQLSAAPADAPEASADGLRR